MGIMNTLSRKLSELAKELTNELEDEYCVVVELHLSTDARPSSDYAKVIITEGVWSVNQITVNIDLDASLSETLLYIKNKFNTTVKFDRYRRKTYSLNSIIEKLNEDKKFIVNRVWWCGESDMLCMRTSNLTNGISRYPLNGKTTFEDKDYKDMISHFDSPTFHTFVIKDYYPEFKSYIRKFIPEISVYEHDDEDESDWLYEGDNFDLHTKYGFCVLSELDVKSLETIESFESFYKRRKEASV